MGRRNKGSRSESRFGEDGLRILAAATEEKKERRTSQARAVES